MSAKLDQLARCRFMGRGEFADGIKAIAGKKVVIVGCGAQGLNQGLNMRDSGCDISYTLRQSAIDAISRRMPKRRDVEKGRALRLAELKQKMGADDADASSCFV